ncbi:MAG: lipoprotein insertase outer membrane protein LolB [Burkholderiales bacterium]
MTPLRRVLLAVCAAALVVGCTGTSRKIELAGRPDVDRFEVTGRIAVRYQGDGYTGSMRWQHAGAHDAVDLYTPVGTLYARLRRDPAGAVMEMADGKRYEDRDAGRLAERVLGWELPLDALSAWLFTRPAPGPAPDRIDADDKGRPTLMVQSGWRVRYHDYLERASTVLPGRVELDRPGLVVKLLVSRWGEPGTPGR